MLGLLRHEVRHSESGPGFTLSQTRLDFDWPGTVVGASKYTSRADSNAALLVSLPSMLDPSLTRRTYHRRANPLSRTDLDVSSGQSMIEKYIASP